MGAAVKVSREKLALAVVWGAIAACAAVTLVAPKATGAAGADFSGKMASLARTGF